MMATSRPDQAWTDLRRWHSTTEDPASLSPPDVVIFGCSAAVPSTESFFTVGATTVATVATLGHGLDGAVIKTLERAVTDGAALIIVLGHEECEAHMAAIEGGHVVGLGGNVTEPAHTSSASNIEPRTGDDDQRATTTRLGEVAALTLSRSPLLTTAVLDGRCAIAWAMQESSPELRLIGSIGLPYPPD